VQQHKRLLFGEKTKDRIAPLARESFDNGKIGFSQALPRGLEKNIDPQRNQRIPKSPDLRAVFPSAFPPDHFA